MPGRATSEIRPDSWDSTPIAFYTKFEQFGLLVLVDAIFLNFSVQIPGKLSFFKVGTCHLLRGREERSSTHRRILQKEHASWCTRSGFRRMCCRCSIDSFNTTLKIEFLLFPCRDARIKVSGIATFSGDKLFRKDGHVATWLSEERKGQIVTVGALHISWACYIINNQRNLPDKYRKSNIEQAQLCNFRLNCDNNKCSIKLTSGRKLKLFIMWISLGVNKILICFTVKMLSDKFWHHHDLSHE